MQACEGAKSHQSAAARPRCAAISAMALNANNANNAAQFELLRSEAQKFDIGVESLDIRKPEDVDAAFDKALAFGAKGLVNNPCDNVATSAR